MLSGVLASQRAVGGEHRHSTPSSPAKNIAGRVYHRDLQYALLRIDADIQHGLEPTLR